MDNPPLTLSSEWSRTIVMAGLDPAIQKPRPPMHLDGAHVLGLDPGIKCGHDNTSWSTLGEFLFSLAEDRAKISRSFTILLGSQPRALAQPR